jgi:putative ABC transport system substrate-binding protein
MQMWSNVLGRREFITLLGSAAAAWPLAAGAQQAPARRLGVLIGRAENDPIYRGWIAAFQHGLGEAGWIPGRNVHIEYRWTNADVERIKEFANELVALKPDVILADGTPVTAALKRETSTIPIVFVVVSDPVGAGFVQSLAHPGGNITGFINYEDAMGGKWLELLKEIAPSVTHAAMIFNPDTAAGAGRYFLPSFEIAARKLGVAPSAAAVRDPAEIEHAMAELASIPGGGLVAMADAFMGVHSKQVIGLAERYKLPAVYGLDLRRVEEGALLTYSPDNPDMFGRSASYVDRILKGESPRDLPVQTPTKFELGINLKTARALGLEVPATLLATAGKVVE